MKVSCFRSISTYLIPFLLLVLFGACAQSEKTKEKNTSTEEKAKQEDQGFDAMLAEKYGADDYGMKKYVIAFLKKGPNRELDKSESEALQKAHMNNIGKMAEEGKLVLAGPFFGDGDLRGLYVFNVESIEEAEALTNSDPAIKAGSLTMELKEWYGSAAVMAISDLHEKVSKIKM